MCFLKTRRALALATCAIGIIILFFGIFGGAASAQTGNVTSSNVTLISPDLAALPLEMEELRQELEGAVTALVRLADFTDRLFELLVIFGVTVIALWQKKDFINIVAAISIFFMAITWLKDYAGLGIALLSLSGWFMFNVSFIPLYKIVREWATWRRFRIWTRRKR